MGFFGFGKKESKKEQKITENKIRIRIHRPRNNTPVEIGVFIAEMSMSDEKNVLIIDEENKFKEELSVLTDACVSDIIYKLKTRTDSKQAQVKELEEAIKDQENRIKDIIDGKITTKKILVDEKDPKGKTQTIEKEIKVNIVSEENKLKVLKVTKFAIDNSGDGSFEIIEEDGMPCMSYLVQDGELIPEFYKMPKEKGELLTIRPEVSANKKHYKETQDIIDRDYLDSTRDPFAGWFRMVLLILTVIGFVVAVFWNVQLTKRESAIDKRESESASNICLKTQADCTRFLGIQMDNNQVYIDYAKQSIKKMNESMQSEAANTRKI